MSFFLSARKLDVTTGDTLIVVINEFDAQEQGMRAGDGVHIQWPENPKGVNVTVDTTDSLVDEGEIGFFEDVWHKYKLHFGEVIKIKVQEPSEAIEAIKEKLKGEKLNYEQFHVIMRDIANHRLGAILTTYFAAAGYNPGFDEEELYYLTKAMAETGDILQFDGIVADKHSIGGVAGKGVTPLVVPIISSVEGITVPNTSTRAITSASATTDMLEVIMPMEFSKEQLVSMAMKSGVFMVWGGGLELAPADDEMIRVEKPLAIESFDKFVASIMAKKVAAGLTHLILDMPVGKGTKVKRPGDVEVVKRYFSLLAEKFGIKIVINVREIKRIDGRAVGPALECREFLRIYEKHQSQSLQLRNDVLIMAGKLLELCEKAPAAGGYKMAEQILDSGQAEKKFREIIQNQGGNAEVTSNDLEIGGLEYTAKAERSGKIAFMHNKKVHQVARALGNPHIKEAGIYFHKVSGEEVKVGEDLVTLYATTKSRIDLGRKVFEQVKGELFELGE